MPRVCSSQERHPRGQHTIARSASLDTSAEPEHLLSSASSAKPELASDTSESLAEWESQPTEDPATQEIGEFGTLLWTPENSQDHETATVVFMASGKCVLDATRAEDPPENKHKSRLPPDGRLCFDAGSQDKYSELSLPTAPLLMTVLERIQANAAKSDQAPPEPDLCPAYDLGSPFNSQRGRMRAASPPSSTNCSSEEPNLAHDTTSSL